MINESQVFDFVYDEGFEAIMEDGELANVSSQS